MNRFAWPSVFVLKSRKKPFSGMQKMIRWSWWPRQPIPASLLVEDGINFLLRQAVVVGCMALESFFWDALRENVLTIVRARKRGADKSLRELTLSLDDYLSLEGYDDPVAPTKQCRLGGTCPSLPCKRLILRQVLPVAMTCNMLKLLICTVL